MIMLLIVIEDALGIVYEYDGVIYSMIALDDMMETAMDFENSTPKMVKFTAMLEVVLGITTTPFDDKI